MVTVLSFTAMRRWPLWARSHCPVPPQGAGRAAAVSLLGATQCRFRCGSGTSPHARAAAVGSGRHGRVVGSGRRVGGAAVSYATSAATTSLPRCFGTGRHDAPAERARQRAKKDEVRRTQRQAKEDELMAEVQASNDLYSGHLELRKAGPHDQWGVFASRLFIKGHMVLHSTRLLNKKIEEPGRHHSHNNVSNAPCSHSIQIDWHRHLLMALPGRFLNHACTPNVGVGNEGGLNEAGSYDFLALRDIEEGEEIRFDYETTEFEIGGFSECRCGAAGCRGSVRGYRHSEAALRARDRAGKHIAWYLKRSGGRYLWELEQEEIKLEEEGRGGREKKESDFVLAHDPIEAYDRLMERLRRK